MADKSKNSKSPNALYEKYTVRHAIVNYYLVLMFTVFPLFFTNYYFNIRHDKYYLFLILSAIIIVAEGVLVLSVKLGKEERHNLKDKIWCRSFSLTDWAMLALLIVCIISTAFSEYPKDAFFGTMGRNNGMLLILCYVGIYFVITRYFYYMEYVMLALAGASAAVYLLAVLNCFYIDPLGMFKQISNEQTINNFTSTIGNKNLLSSYICIALPVTVTMSVHTKKTAGRILCLAASGLGFAALMTADSYSGILGILVFAVIFLIYYSRNVCRLKRFFLAFAIMLISAKLLRLFSLCMGDKSKGMSDFQSYFVYSNSSYIILAVVAVITALLYFADYKNPGIRLSKAVPVALTVITLTVIIGILAAVIYFSCINLTAGLGSLESFFRFNDGWGTHRGYMWIRSFKAFGDFSVYNKIFGSGPDTFYAVFAPYFEGLKKFGDATTNAAHNEYLNYLITIGITGLAAYLCVIGGAIKSAANTAAKNPLALVCVSAVICYATQAVVNIAQPITTPLFFIFIALCEGVARQTKNSDEIKLKL